MQDFLSINILIIFFCLRFEEIMAASQDIAASTAQLVIASRVKAREGSTSFGQLREASKVNKY